MIPSRTRRWVAVAMLAVGATACSGTDEVRPEPASVSTNMMLTSYAPPAPDVDRLWGTDRSIVLAGSAGLWERTGPPGTGGWTSWSWAGEARWAGRLADDSLVVVDALGRVEVVDGDLTCDPAPVDTVIDGIRIGDHIALLAVDSSVTTLVIGSPACTWTTVALPVETDGWSEPTLLVVDGDLAIADRTTLATERWSDAAWASVDGGLGPRLDGLDPAPTRDDLLVVGQGTDTVIVGALARGGLGAWNLDADVTSRRDLQFDVGSIDLVDAAVSDLELQILIRRDGEMLLLTAGSAPLG